MNTSGISGTVFVVIAYTVYFWRMFKNNPGNRLVQCAIMTLVTFVAFIAFLTIIPLGQIGGVPDWLLVSWVILVVLLCLSTIFFLAQRIRQSGRRDRS
jgi:heme A synthase